ncbi:Sodium/hydrogen exchanger 4, partial [Bienertia sinuspersici]
GCLTRVIILFISKGKNSHILRFDEEQFFIYLLPPIIFNARFQVKKKQFFQNFLTIMLLGVIGVFISTTIISVGNMQTHSFILFIFPHFNSFGLKKRSLIPANSPICLGSWWLFPKVGFAGLIIRDYLGKYSIHCNHLLVCFMVFFITELISFLTLNSAIGTIFSSSATVCTLQVLNQDDTPLLYNLVFGEGVVNDATSVV